MMPLLWYVCLIWSAQLLENDVLDPATHLRSNCIAASAAGASPSNRDVARWHVELLPCPIPTRFDCDSVITGTVRVVLDKDIFTGIRVDTVSILAVLALPLCRDGDVGKMKSLGGIRMDSPKW